MSRLIDADKLDEEVMHLFIAITGNPKQSIIVDECKKSFRNIIDEQPTVELPETAKWIPCSERTSPGCRTNRAHILSAQLTGIF